MTVAVANETDYPMDLAALNRVIATASSKTAINAGICRRRRKSGSQSTLRWREMDSNFRFHVRNLGIRLELN